MLFYDTVCILSYSINVYCYSMILCILSHTCSINVYYYSMIDKAYLNVLVVISKLLGQSILGIRQLPRMNMLVLKKDWLRHPNQYLREKVNVVVLKPK